MIDAANVRRPANDENEWSPFHDAHRDLLDLTKHQSDMDKAATVRGYMHAALCLLVAQHGEAKAREIAESCIDNVFRLQRKPAPILTGAKTIARDVADKYQVHPATLSGPEKSARIVAARQEYMWRLREEMNMTFPAIGRLVKRHHTTALYGWRAEAARRAARMEAGE